MPRWSKVLLWALGSLIGAALAFAVFQPIKVLPRIRVAPGFALADQSGEAFTSESARGRVTLYSFMPLDCGAECADAVATLRSVRDAAADGAIDLADTEFTIVTVALADDPTVDQLGAMAASIGADGGDWRVVGADWERIRTLVGSGFRRYVGLDDTGTIEFDGGFVIVDPGGVIRAEYRYRTLSSDRDKLVRQLGILGDEIRYAHGAAGLAYEAAHLFLCYG